MPVLLFAFLYVTQASTCHADVSQVGTSPLGLRFPPFPADQSVRLQEGFVFPRIVGHPIEFPSCSLSVPRFFRAGSFAEPEVCSADLPGSSSNMRAPSGSLPAPYNSGVGFCGPLAPSLERRGSLHTSHSVAQAGFVPPAKSANHKSKLAVRGSIEHFLEQHGSSFQQTVPGWQGMLELSALKPCIHLESGT